MPEDNIDFSFLIVTFKERLEYVKDLILKIRASSNKDIVLAVNGNNEELMTEEYRKEIIAFCFHIPNCYPIVCPEFRSLPKLWNTLVIFSRTEYNFVICDDVEYGIGADIPTKVESYIKTTGEEFFTINGGFSHFVITKTRLHKLNYFDERLCGFGEEDGDIVHQFILQEGRTIPLLRIPEMYNKALYTIKNKDIETHIDNKPRFNREFIYLKYKDDPNGICGMNPTPVSLNMPNYRQYPYERFVEANKHNIKKFDKVVITYE